MSLRNKHTFQFSGSQLSKHASFEAEHHAKRAAWWNTEYEKALAHAKELGVQVREYDVTGGKRAEVCLDPSVSTRINEAAQKRMDHQKRAETLALEAEAYDTQKDRVFELDSDDVQHFRLVGGPREE